MFRSGGIISGPDRTGPSFAVCSKKSQEEYTVSLYCLFWDGHLIVHAGLRSLIFLCLCVPPFPPPVLATPCYVIPVMEPRPPCILGKHSTNWAPVQYTILKSTYTCLEHFISLFWVSCWSGLWHDSSLVQEWLSSAHNFVCKQGLITLEVGDCYSELTCLRHNSSTLLILG